MQYKQSWVLVFPLAPWGTGHALMWHVKEISRADPWGEPMKQCKLQISSLAKAIWILETQICPHLTLIKV